MVYKFCKVTQKLYKSNPSLFDWLADRPRKASACSGNQQYYVKFTSVCTVPIRGVTKMMKKVLTFAMVVFLAIIFVPGVNALAAPDLKVSVEAGLDGKVKFGRG